MGCTLNPAKPFLRWCSRSQGAVGGVYPSAVNERYFAVAADTVTPALADGTGVLYMHGCFVYTTFGKRHRSSYCFYLEPVADQPSEKWPLKNCPGEGQAYAD